MNEEMSTENSRRMACEYSVNLVTWLSNF